MCPLAERTVVQKGLHSIGFRKYFMSFMCSNIEEMHRNSYYWVLDERYSELIVNMINYIYTHV